MPIKATTNWQEELERRLARMGHPSPVVISDSVRDRITREFKGTILYQEPMSQHTSIRLGGPADVFLRPRDQEGLSRVLQIAREEGLPCLILGSGSNLLVRDHGIRGFVVSLGECCNTCRIVSESGEGVDVQAGAGLGITAFVHFTRDHSLTGMEALIGIPGTMGGAMVMNAGARGTEIADLIREMTIMDSGGQMRVIPREDLEFGYRTLKLPRSSVVLGGIFRLSKGEPQEIRNRIREYQKIRVETQPLNFPNVGSVFKNPQPTRKNEVTSTAARLIEEAGLKNIRVGGARVSERHANFIIREKEEATSRDVVVLINLIRDKVKESTGILLETEVKIVGEE